MSYLPSTRPCTVYGVVGKDATLQAVQEILAGAAGSDAGIKARIRRGTLADVAASTEAAAADAVLVECDPADTGQVDQLAALMAGPLAATPVLVTAPLDSVSAARTLMRLGVADVIPQPIQARDLITAIRDAVGKRDTRAKAAPPHGTVISVLKAGGGSGATTMAVNLACAAARAKQGTPLLLDLDIQFGMAGLQLDITARQNSHQVLLAAQRLDDEMMDNVVARHATGVHVLPAPDRVMPLETVSPEMAQHLISYAAHTYGTVVVDLPSTWTAWSLAVLEQSDVIVLVTQMTVPGIRQTHRQVTTLAAEGLAAVPLVPVVNRYQPGWFAKDPMLRRAEESLDLSLKHFVPSDFKGVTAAINAGQPLARGNAGRGIVKRIDRLAAAVRAAATPAVVTAGAKH